MLVALAGFSQNTRAENSNPIAGVVAEVMIASPLDQVAGDRIGAGVRELVQDEQIPQAVNGSFVLPDLTAASTVQNLDRLQQVPKDFRDEQTVPTIALPESGSEREENWDWTEVNGLLPTLIPIPDTSRTGCLSVTGIRRSASSNLSPAVRDFLSPSRYCLI